MTFYIFNTYLTPLQKITFWLMSLFLFTFFWLGDLPQKQAKAQSSDTEVYWVYTRGDLGYRLQLQQASQQGIVVDQKGRELTFRVQMTQNAFENLRQSQYAFPINVEWYRYNRAKLSLYDVNQVDINQIGILSIDGEKLYRISSTQKNILSGTWIVKISDAKGKYLTFSGKTEFDVIVF